MKIIGKLKLSLIMEEFKAWSFFGDWLDNRSPMWFQILYWGTYHTIKKDFFELQNSTTVTDEAKS